jgi:uncharacterized membrane protein (DUF4010 family)
MTAATAMSPAELFGALGTALGLGLLVGLEREWVKDQVAGIRTFALITLSGALAALIASTYGGWVIAAALLCLAMLILIGNLPAVLKKGTAATDIGLTTEFAMLVMFFTGMLPMLGHPIAATVIAGVVMVLLQSKEVMHGVVRKIGEAELKAIARLVLIGLVILPVLPNEDYGYYGVFNPFKIWLMVVLIVGLSLVAYLIGKFIGPNKGLLVSGLLGGLISSTATTASLSRQSKDTKASPPLLAVVIMIASTVVFGRVVAEILMVAPKAGQTMIYPFLAMMAWMAVVSVVCWLLARKEIVKPPQSEPPSEIKGAVMFGLLYALVLLGVAVARHNFGQAGLFTVAAISGLTDMDAITLSTANLVNSNHLDPGTAWRVILTGGVANLVFKGLMVVTVGSRALAGWVAIVFGISILGAGLIAWLWPA